MRCDACSRLGYMADPSVHVDLRRVVRAIDQALAVCVHGHPMTERCLACAVLRAGTQP